MDRMPKEFKIIVYFVVLRLVFIDLFVFKMFDRFRYFSILYAGVSISIIFLLTLLLFLFKKDISRILFLVLYGIHSVIFVILISGLIFFKQTVEIAMRLINSSKFDIYLLMSMIFKSRVYGVIAMSILLFWSIFTIFLLTQEELVNFLRTKEYPLVNTQKYTVSLLALYIISLFAASYIMLF
jgi:hypothetical protein